MIKIAHRGNTRGPIPDFENDPDYVINAIKMGYDVEVDVWWRDGKIFFGHDYPQYDIRPDQFRKITPHAWFHCKDLFTLRHFVEFHSANNYFWHQNDNFTLTNKNFIWTYPKNETTDMSILVDPDLSSGIEYDKIYGVCTDYPELLG